MYRRSVKREVMTVVWNTNKDFKKRYTNNNNWYGVF